MTQDFVPYQESFELKEMGFDESCFAFWDAYNGGTHLFFETRVKYRWPFRLFKKEPNVRDFSQGLLEYIEGENAILAPTFSQAFRWFREKHGYCGLVEIGTQEYSYQIFNKNGNCQLGKEPLSFNGSFEEAELECLRKLIRLAKEKKQQ